jgi:hypothetical protein
LGPGEARSQASIGAVVQPFQFGHECPRHCQVRPSDESSLLTKLRSMRILHNVVRVELGSIVGLGSSRGQPGAHAKPG